MAGVVLSSNLFLSYFVLEMLTSHNLELDDVELVDVAAADVPARLADGPITAGHTRAPYLTQAGARGRHVWLSSEQTPDLLPNVIAVRSSLVREHPEAVRALADAYFRALTVWEVERETINERLAAQLKVEPKALSLEGIELLDRQANRELMRAQTSRPLAQLSAKYGATALELVGGWPVPNGVGVRPRAVAATL